MEFIITSKHGPLTYKLEYDDGMYVVSYIPRIR